MYRKSKINLSAWLVAAAILAALNLGGIDFAWFPQARAAETAAGRYSAAPLTVCEPSSAESCPGRMHARKLGFRHMNWRGPKPRGEAKRFAERIKLHLGRRFGARKRQFRRHQVQMERQRRRSKARSKARQFAAARRHAARHAPKRRHFVAAKFQKSGHRKPKHRDRPGTPPNGSSAQTAPRWRSLWRHGAHNAALQPPSD